MKFVLTAEKKVEFGISFSRIKAMKDIPNIGVKKGELGGWIEKKDNLSQEGDAWVFGNAWVSGDAKVFGDARVFGNAWVSGDAKVFGNAWVSGDAEVSGRITIEGKIKVSLEIKRLNFSKQKDMDAYIKQNNELAEKLMEGKK